MQQTLLALAALLAFSVYALSRHQESADVERSAISSEMSHAAGELARSVMMRIEERPFDEQSIGRTGMNRGLPMPGLGPETDETSRPMYDDVDDFNGAAWTEAIPRGADSLRFAVSVIVNFVQDSNPDVVATSPSFSKAVEVRVSEEIPRGAMRPQAVANIRRVLTAAGQSLQH